AGGVPPRFRALVCRCAKRFHSGGSSANNYVLLFSRGTAHDRPAQGNGPNLATREIQQKMDTATHPATTTAAVHSQEESAGTHPRWRGAVVPPLTGPPGARSRDRGSGTPRLPIAPGSRWRARSA